MQIEVYCNILRFIYQWCILPKITFLILRKNDCDLVEIKSSSIILILSSNNLHDVKILQWIILHNVFVIFSDLDPDFQSYLSTAISLSRHN